MPIGSELTVKLADPDARIDEPNDVLPDEKAMLPVGATEPETGVTVAVSVAGLFNVSVVGETDSAVVVPINVGGVFAPELPFPPQPMVNERKPNTAIVTA